MPASRQQSLTLQVELTLQSPASDDTLLVLIEGLICGGWEADWLDVGSGDVSWRAQVDEGDVVGEASVSIHGEPWMLEDLS